MAVCSTRAALRRNPLISVSPPEKPAKASEEELRVQAAGLAAQQSSDGARPGQRLPKQKRLWPVPRSAPKRCGTSPTEPGREIYLVNSKRHCRRIMISAGSMSAALMIGSLRGESGGRRCELGNGGRRAREQHRFSSAAALFRLGGIFMGLWSGRTWWAGRGRRRRARSGPRSRGACRARCGRRPTWSAGRSVRGGRAATGTASGAAGLQSRARRGSCPGYSARARLGGEGGGDLNRGGGVDRADPRDHLAVYLELDLFRVGGGEALGRAGETEKGGMEGERPGQRRIGFWRLWGRGV